MGTRSTISMENKDGTVTGVYCHWDGYVSHNGNLLYQFYREADTVSELIAMGNISGLGREIGVAHPFDSPHKFGTPEYFAEREQWQGMTTFYGRDRGEQGQEAETYPTLRAFMDEQSQEFNYHFKDGEWSVSEDGVRFTRLKALLEESFTV